MYLAEVRPPTAGNKADTEKEKHPPTPPTPPMVVAAKVMDRKELEGRNKEGRARTEREILEAVDHPFLPRLYGVAEGDRWSCLLTEFCPGGDLHVLRQRQPHRRFSESAVRCAVAHSRLPPCCHLKPPSVRRRRHRRPCSFLLTRATRKFIHHCISNPYYY